MGLTMSCGLSSAIVICWQMTIADDNSHEISSFISLSKQEHNLKILSAANIIGDALRITS